MQDVDLLQLNITLSCFVLFGFFFSLLRRPLAYTSASDMKARQRSDPHLGCTLSSNRLVAAIKLCSGEVFFLVAVGLKWQRSAAFAAPEDIIRNHVLPLLTLPRNSMHF